MARIEAGQFTVDKAPWDIVGSTHQLLASLHAISWLAKLNLKETLVMAREGKEVAVQVFPPNSKNPPPKVILHADGNLMERAIGNLLDNAIKHTPKSGEIEIVIEDLPARVQVSARDTGEGIPPDALEKIFNKFQQLSGTKGGTGLGLTFTKHTIERHGGQISAASKVGQGATFTFWIPK